MSDGRHSRYAQTVMGTHIEAGNVALADPRPMRRRSPRGRTYTKTGPHTPMGHLAAAITQLALEAQDGRDTSKRQRAILQRVRRMLGKP